MADTTDDLRMREKRLRKALEKSRADLDEAQRQNARLLAENTRLAAAHARRGEMLTDMQAELMLVKLKEARNG